MRKLWTDHVVWTRDYIIATIGDQPDAKAAADRLMKNQEDIGNAVAKFYGAAAGQQLTTILKEHITIAVDLIKAAKAGDKAAQQQGDDRWQQNAVQIADFLSKANPNWPTATLTDLMKTHLSTTTDEVVARLKQELGRRCPRLRRRLRAHPPHGGCSLRGHCQTGSGQVCITRSAFTLRLSLTRRGCRQPDAG